ncbi:uncharacterized protein BDR25DRAFT_353392 [Lindgomyces ingoldianus]|uniref:Uncharacterized protein n=1 Tax=Lindgomyces ingoldianus TaxID=673940 RepID=A0ACB6R1N9_9PLEO|nr:uncharacterized protein BDR25DRAFT_353392 [Lindgomyces ingoldianus]KAF2472356.1 hypothetical protein BDR25DRAFT_353392 [Lindgomyces ingoldianus]
MPPMVDIYNSSAGQNGWLSKVVIMDCQHLSFPDLTFTHIFLSFGLPIIADRVAAAAQEFYTMKTGGTAVTAFCLNIPQGDMAREMRHKVWRSDATVTIEPHLKHKDPNFNRELLVQMGFRFEDVRLYEKSNILKVEDICEFVFAILSAIREEAEGWTEDDDERWDEAIKIHKMLLSEKKGYHADENRNIKLGIVAQIAIMRKEV